MTKQTSVWRRSFLADENHEDTKTEMLKTEMPRQRQWLVHTRTKTRRDGQSLLYNLSLSAWHVIQRHQLQDYETLTAEVKLPYSVTEPISTTTFRII